MVVGFSGYSQNHYRTLSSAKSGYRIDFISLNTYFNVPKAKNVQSDDSATAVREPAVVRCVLDFFSHLSSVIPQIVK
jgi:hypothetical protein